jgi:hypothetical protein
MSQKPKFDPARVASLLNGGAEEGRGVLGRSAGPVLTAVPATAPAEPVATAADISSVAETDLPSPTIATEKVAVDKQPVTARLTTEVLHALVRHQAELRCKPGARLGDTTIGGVMDSLLRQALGMSPLG